MRTFRPHHFEGLGQYLVHVHHVTRAHFEQGGKATPTRSREHVYKVCYNNFEHGTEVCKVFLVSMSDGRVLLPLIGEGDTNERALENLIFKMNTLESFDFRFATREEVINAIAPGHTAESKVLELAMAAK